jgi:hypothetical protein
MLLGSGDEIDVLISDNEDDEDQQENLNEGVFIADDDRVLLGAGVNVSLIDSDDENRCVDNEEGFWSDFGTGVGDDGHTL